MHYHNSELQTALVSKPGTLLLYTEINVELLMPDENEDFRGCLVLDFASL